MTTLLRLQVEGPRLSITLARPEVHNALNGELIAALGRAVREAAALPEVRYVVLAGEGPSFCAGGDLAFMRAMAGRPAEVNRVEAGALFETLDAMVSCPKPIIARVHGAALAGGMGLVAAADLAVAHPAARFGLTEVRVGVPPAMIFPFLLRKVARHHLLWAALTGERFPAARALEMGLVNEVAEDPDGVVATWGRDLLAGGPEALAGVKHLARRLPQLSWDEVRALTVDLIVRSAVSPEGQEGMLAFLEKRRPRWAPE
ncbi:MAG: enoyl-CoA hydratase-related protein [Armatimonadota bacterium]|nr:enoyl-CoA hydratase-related protein [Armatimonadota bacterium]MDR7453227.1 enoyl-CoA hydratase-related protein [Armatimonadota bacterium]MDR7455844.1 enoyl-CoA hydratase-related protein [Armatimonadota bacterium]MDR7497085.1 enoyl-CoA hydratase-related protein [Armatimonadota bacterium]MDR7511925.1 enoyl-CoA hydratase-related protein [Armatimonadota bacterium]